MSTRTPDFSDDGDLEPVERIAAGWILRREQGLSREEQRAMANWLGESPQHASVFAEMDETSRLLDEAGRRVTDNVIPFTPLEKPRRPKLAGLRVALGMAAAVAIGFLSWRQFAPVKAPFMQVVSTEIGASRTVDLPDGSVVHLNTDTAIEVNYLPAERRLKLVRGEAYFTVAKDKSRPFWVQAGPVAVRAVGTAFNIRINPSVVNVIVTEGKVRVVEGDHSIASPQLPADTGSMLIMGQLAEVALGNSPSSPGAAVAISSIQARAMKNALAWQEGRLEFFETPLSEVVAEFNRYNSHKIIIADPLLATRRFGGAFASHQVAPLIELLEQSFGVVSEERPDGTVLRVAK